MARNDPPEVTVAFDVSPRGGAAAARRACAVVLSGPHFGEVLELASGTERILGRAPEADLTLRDGGVSRRHAALSAEGAGAVLRDLGSQNGTWVDGQRVRECRLVDGQRFLLGAHTTLKLVAGGDAEAALLREFAEGSMLEPLTGLHNLRAFRERLSAELAAAQRHGHALALLVLDLDQLRRVNDVHGTAGGDAALRLVADALRTVLRREDHAARIGGDELAVLAPRTDLTGARALGERLRKAVERARGAAGPHTVAVTVSIGAAVSQGITAFEAGRTERQLLETAERALVRAKQLGRNTIVATPALAT